MTNKISRRGVLLSAGALSVSGCSFRVGSRAEYTGLLADGIIVRKGDRRMYLLKDATVLRAYDVDLGFNPTGHKEVYGDGRTPEGGYRIDRRNENSAYHLSLGISYPDANDIARAEALGVDPGGDIFIHGGPNLLADKDKADWTAGCISVSNAEMEEIFDMVPTGIPIWIQV